MTRFGWERVPAPVTDGVVTRDHLTTQGVDPEPETWTTDTETTPPGDTTAREALVEKLSEAMWRHHRRTTPYPPGFSYEYPLAATYAEGFLAGPLSDRRMVERLPGAAGLVREGRAWQAEWEQAARDGLKKLAELRRAQTELDEARAKLARVEALRERLLRELVPSVPGEAVKKAVERRTMHIRQAVTLLNEAMDGTP